MPENIEILVEPIDDLRLPVDLLRDLVARHAGVREHFADADPRMLRFSDPDFLGREPDRDGRFMSTVFDPRSNLSMELSGTLDQLDEIEARPSAFRPNPFPDELKDAVELLRADERYVPLASRDEVVIYQPMPPLADVELDDGTTTRRVTLGILDPDGSPLHRFVAVDLYRRFVDWEPVGLDPPTDDDCEARLPVGVGSLPDAGGPSQVRVRVLLGGQELWNMIVVRPRNSTPTAYGKGAGVELRQVRYRGHLVFWQAHVPILDVLYDDGVSYRDWQNQETPFYAIGVDPVGSGWRVCNQPPATILEAGTDAGNFQGVALWYDQGELRIVSEMQAGWYRYVSDWRLRDDGTIGPRFGFAGTRNPRTCMRHHHHVYWRLDFDIDGAGRDVIEQRGLFFPWLPLWSPILRETSRRRDFFARSWQVLDQDTNRGYRITPGAADGTADAYGVSDMWFLHYRGTELDDGVALVGGTAAQTQVRLDQYLTGESIAGTDVVVWYAGHFMHDEHAPAPHQGHIIGPELRPVNW
jgi:hypothetical protein